MRQKIRINYTIYSPDYVPELGECWDYSRFRGAKGKAKSLGPGSLIVRNLDQYSLKGEFLDYSQADRCWLWDAVRFRRLHPLTKETWAVAKKAWWPASSLKHLRGNHHYGIHS